ncbi:hypothetical protein DEU56DRAFT_778196 [Suillus clintonianus]|uniref:uncharacterized protein n=1 Tax=Suillus clintonianus TaxID=1904413 RepID=UPI001B85D5DD|nr:uncharacterized protein DEU56DRAFT_778196 [Suillus clintonianus]KAG2151494.1 hypothetical protein DEU56DRAFT_778196 [Suillus clintonianus]
MDPPKSKTTIRISTNLGPASQFEDSLMTVIELKGRTHSERGEHYLQLSLVALKELAGLLEDERLSAKDKATFNRAYIAGRDRYDDVKIIRDRLLAQKKSFRMFIVNLFVRESEAKHFHKVSYRNFSSIKRTSEDLNRLLLPDKNDILATSGSASESAQAHGDVSVCEESPCDVVEGNISVRDLPPNETLRGINVDVHTEQEANEVLATLNRFNQSTISEEEAGESDDDRTIRAPISQSRPSSPSPSFTIIYNYNVYSHSVVSVDSEVTGTTINSGVNGGVGSAIDANKSLAPLD